MLSFLHLRFVFCWPLCAFLNYTYLLTRKQKLLSWWSDSHLDEAWQEFVGDVSNGAENVIKLHEQKLCVRFQLVLQFFRLWLTATKPTQTKRQSEECTPPPFNTETGSVVTGIQQVHAHACKTTLITTCMDLFQNSSLLWSITCPLPKLHQNPPVTSWVILLTNSQTQPKHYRCQHVLEVTPIIIPSILSAFVTGQITEHTLWTFPTKYIYNIFMQFTNSQTNRTII